VLDVSGPAWLGFVLGCPIRMKKCAYCGRKAAEVLTTCPECGTALPEQPLGVVPPPVLTPSQVRARRRSLLEGCLWVILALGVLVAGWSYPVWFLQRDPVMRNDMDTRLGPALLFSFIASGVFAFFALKSFSRARSPETSCILR
jgi:hypothetical protein